jgi:hypothetical protein
LPLSPSFCSVQYKAYPQKQKAGGPTLAELLPGEVGGDMIFTVMEGARGMSYRLIWHERSSYEPLYIYHVILSYTFKLDHPSLLKSGVAIQVGVPLGYHFLRKMSIRNKVVITNLTRIFTYKAIFFRADLDNSFKSK